MQLQITVDLPIGKEDIMLAFLTDFPFYAFTSEPGRIEAYLHQTDYEDSLLDSIRSLALDFKIRVSQKILEEQNWNQVWEANFAPIEVGDFCGIRAPFHPPFSGMKHEIVMNPEMAFGTGHHATTYMMIQLMEQLRFSNKKVLDYGCGTGVLAILADKMGANLIDAVDIELPAYENTIKNAEENKANQVKAIHGVLEDVRDKDYQIILANINRNVILASLASLYEQLLDGGKLLLSGILKSDQEKVIKAAADVGFIYQKHLEKGEWIAILLEK